MRRWLRRLVFLGLAIFLLTAVAVVAAAAVMQGRHGGGRSPGRPVEAAIVLGAGVDPDGILHYSTRRRVAAGVAMLRTSMADRLIMSGGIVDGPGVSAAALMRDHAVALGAPAGAILLEGAAVSTFENVRFSLDLAARAGLGRLALVTDDYHLPRASWLACYFGNCGIALVAVPAFDSAGWIGIARDIGREALAWWYNLGKIALWSALDYAGIPEDRREHFVR